MKKKNNKDILFIAATHGDEDFSVGIFKKLEKLKNSYTQSYDWIIGNERAYQKKVRFVNYLLK